MTEETGKRPDGAAAARRAVYGPRDIRVDHYEGIPRLGVAAADTSYATVRASFSPLKTDIPCVSKGMFCGASCGKARRQIIHANWSIITEMLHNLETVRLQRSV
jgi:hypothetical protein